MRFGAVINISAGSMADTGNERAQLIQSRLADLVEPGAWRWTAGQDAAQQARQLLQQGVDGLIAGGGDGTVSAVAGVAAKADTCLGVLPLGTRNHFARDLDIPASLDEAIDVIRRMRRRRVDLGEVNGSTFINNVSLGLYPHMILLRDRYRREHGWKKLSAQIAAAWRVIRRFPLSRLHLELDDRRLVRITPMLVVANNAYQDGLLADARRPALDRGKLWVGIARAHHRLALLRVSRDFLTGRAGRLTRLEAVLVDSARVTLRRARATVAIDGEFRRMAAPLVMRSRPLALQVIVP